MRRLVPLLIALGIVAVFVAGVRSKPVAAAVVAVDIVDNDYQPSVRSAFLGDAVVWTNTGATQHTTTSDTGRWDSGTIAPALAFTVTFTETGTFFYHCTIHSNMHGSIQVFIAPTATHTPTRTRTPTNTPTRTATATPQANYIPIVSKPLPSPTPTATPTNTPLPTVTPIPPPLQDIVIQPFQVSSSYDIDAFRELKNDEAAKNYRDPTAALAAFQAQGRESSWYARYLSSFLNPLGISSQGVRYLTAVGADQGYGYALVEELAVHPDNVALAFSAGDQAVAYRRGFIENGKAYYTYFFQIRKGRHVAFVRVVGYQADLSFSTAASYARRAEARLP